MKAESPRHDPSVLQLAIPGLKGVQGRLREAGQAQVQSSPDQALKDIHAVQKKAARGRGPSPGCSPKVEPGAGLGAGSNGASPGPGPVGREEQVSGSAGEGVLKQVDQAIRERRPCTSSALPRSRCYLRPRGVVDQRGAAGQLR